MAFDCMEDCIHLHACRRLQQIGKNLRLMIPRYCDEECSAYERAEKVENVVTVDTAIEYARDGMYDVIAGDHDPFDVYVDYDLDSYTLDDAYRIVPGKCNYQDRGIEGTPLYVLHLNSRSIHALEKAGIKTVEDLEVMSQKELMKIRSLGTISIEKIMVALENYRDKFKPKTDAEIVDGYN